MFLTISQLFFLAGPAIQSCRHVKEMYPNSVSGEYKLTTPDGSKIAAYCEFGLGGSAFTFLHPSALRYVTDPMLQDMRDRNSNRAILRFRLLNGTQTYAVVSQLPMYSHVPLYVGIGADPRTFQIPRNTVAYPNEPYIFLGFLNITLAANRNMQGITANGVDLAFANSDSNPNSYFAVFPVWSETAPSNYGSGWGGFSNMPVCSGLMNAMKTPNSHRDMPNDYFMFAEAHFGGGGCYAQTDHDETIVHSMAIGFY